jgi:TolB-like protein
LNVSQDERVIEFGGFRLDPVERSLVSPGGTAVQLTRRLYDTLLYMVERPGRLLEKQVLLDAVWKGAVVEENTLSRTISALRQALGERERENRFIETVSGVGYRFVQPVTITEARRTEAAALREQPSIAVLPFEDLSRERDQAYFADGIAEEVLNRLATIDGLRLIAKSSSFRFRDRADGARAIGRSLGADYLLVGAVRKEGTHLRITVQLIEAATDSQRWSERFDRELEHIFAIQDDIARAAATALRATLGSGEPSLVAYGTANLEAYDLYLRGRAIVFQGGGPAMVRSAELFREAVTLDPSFAEAWSALASASRGKLVFAAELAAEAVADFATATAKTIELAPRWWVAHVVQAWLHHQRREWLDVERALDRAGELAPGTPTDLAMSLGIFATQINDSETAIARFREAARGDPLSLLLSGLLQKELIMAGRDDEAQVEYRRSLDLAGDREMVEHLVIHGRWARGEPLGEQFRRYLNLTQTKPAPVLEEVYAVRHEPARALEKLRAAVAAPEYQIPPRQLVLSWWMASYGDVESAFGATWRAFVDMQYLNVSWLWFPVLAGVREHARFPELLARVGLTDYWRAKGRDHAVLRVR